MCDEAPQVGCWSGAGCLIVQSVIVSIQCTIRYDTIEEFNQFTIINKLTASRQHALCWFNDGELE